MGLMNYVAREVSRLLKIGKNVVSLLSTTECTSFQEVKVIDGNLTIVGMKDKEFDWVTPTPQIAVHLKGDSGSHVHRFATKGYLKWDKLTKEQQESGKYIERGSYACIKTKKGLDREESDSSTATCIEKIEKFLLALNQGVSGVVDVDRAIAGSTKFIVEIVRDSYMGKDYLVAKDFYAITSNGEVELDELSS